MKKRKITYSLTAQQKKKLKRGENLDNQVKEEEVLTPEEQAAQEEAALTVKKNRKKLILAITASALAVVLIVIAVLIPIWTAEKVNDNTFLHWKNFNPKDPDNLLDEKDPNFVPNPNPTATVTLTGDDKEAFKQYFGAEKVSIKFELFMDDAEFSAMNFMYLAESGFYDGTIINEIYNNHAMFCGFTEAKNGANRALDTAFVFDKLKGFAADRTSTIGENTYKLGYRLTRERGREDYASKNKLGYLVMLAGNNSAVSTSTGFMIFTDEDVQFSILNGKQTSTSVSSSLSWMGKAVDKESEEIIRKLNTIPTAVSGNMVAPTVTVRISSIETSLSKARKEYLIKNFEHLIDTGKTTWKDEPYRTGSSYYNFGK